MTITRSTATSLALLLTSLAAACEGPVPAAQPSDVGDGGIASEPSGDVGTPPPILDPETGEPYEMNPNVRPSVSSDGEVGVASEALVREYSDETGVIHLQIRDCWAGPARHVRATCSVDPEYVLIGGGAAIFYGTPPRFDTWDEDHSGGGTIDAMLTESRPVEPDWLNPDVEPYRYWAGASRDYPRRPSSHSLMVFAVGLRLSGVPRDVLVSHLQTRSERAIASNPVVQATLDPGYVMIGGGARIERTRDGVTYLTRSSPTGHTSADDRTWMASARSHVESAATLRAYVIGIRPTIPGFGTLEFATTGSGIWTTAGRHASWNMWSWTHDGWVGTCPGGWSNWELGTEGPGRYLTRIVPGVNDDRITEPLGERGFAVVADKDLVRGDGGWLMVWVRMIRRRPDPVFVFPTLPLPVIRF